MIEKWIAWMTFRFRIHNLPPNVSLLPLMAHCAGSSKPGWRRPGQKGGVRSTLNCVLWFRKFEHRLSACCVGFTPAGEASGPCLHA